MIRAAGLDHLESVRAAHAGEHWDAGSPDVLLRRAQADLHIATGQGQHALRAIDGRDAANPLLVVPAALVHLLAGDTDTAGNLPPRRWPRTTCRPAPGLNCCWSTPPRFGWWIQQKARRLVRQALAIHRRAGLLRAYTVIASATLAELLTEAGDELDSAASARLTHHRTVYPSRIQLITLTSRQRAVLAALVTTSSRQDIASQLQVSVNTVKTQLRTLYQKFGTTTREATLQKAYEEQLLS